MIKKLIFGLITGAIVLLLIINIVLELQGKTILAEQKEVKETYAQQRQRVLGKLSQLMVLPDKEVPDILTIREGFLKLQKYPVFAKAKKGDILIMYPKYHKKMIIYDEKQHKIIDVVSLNSQPGAVTEFGDLGKK